MCVHRDIKPDNVLVSPGSPNGAGRATADRVKVVDFGLARFSAARGGAFTGRAIVGFGGAAFGAPSLERCPMGTPQYMAPEAVLAPETVDARTDLYAVGALGYFLLTGTHVFDGPTDAVLRDQLRCAPLPPSDRLGAPVPADLEALVLACLAKDPRARPPSAADLRAALRRHPADATWSEASAAQFWGSVRGSLTKRVTSAVGASVVRGSGAGMSREGDTSREHAKTLRFPRAR